jgi:hypothetical protein
VREVSQVTLRYVTYCCAFNVAEFSLVFNARIKFIIMLTNTQHFFSELPLSLRVHFTKLYLIINLPSLSSSPKYLFLILKILIQNQHETNKIAVSVA